MPSNIAPVDWSKETVYNKKFTRYYADLRNWDWLSAFHFIVVGGTIGSGKTELVNHMKRYSPNLVVIDSDEVKADMQFDGDICRDNGIHSSDFSNAKRWEMVDRALRYITSNALGNDLKVPVLVATFNSEDSRNFLLNEMVDGMREFHVDVLFIEVGSPDLEEVLRRVSERDTLGTKDRDIAEHYYNKYTSITDDQNLNNLTGGNRARLMRYSGHKSKSFCRVAWYFVDTTIGRDSGHDKGS